MSEYEEFAKERETIDVLLKKGYVIKGLKDNLDGAMVVFEKEKETPEKLHVFMAETRKYISNLIFNKQQET